jgi:predicted GNAT family acetyltransferase
LDEQQAAADGFRIVHEPGEQRYAIYQGDDDEGRLVGEAHYSFVGEHTIDFDHTVVLPELRGTGLAALLAHHALTGDAIGHRDLQTSCWFIEGYLSRHPELRER